MKDLTRDSGNWRILCFQQFSSPKYDFLEQRSITSGFILVHIHQSARIYTCGNCKSELRRMLGRDEYMNLNYYKLIYLIDRNKMLSNDLKMSNSRLPKYWVLDLFNSPRFREVYEMHNTSDYGYSDMLRLIANYVYGQVCIGRDEQLIITNFYKEVLNECSVLNKKRENTYWFNICMLSINT